MAFTVKDVCKLSGVSVRTLHFYDEIGLLKPASYGENGYRYYEEAQLLELQQILFFRELGFKLDAIRRILASDAFEQLDALHDHRHLLNQRVERLHTLIGTIDKTIAHLKGMATMATSEMYDGFDRSEEERYEKELVERYGDCVRDQFETSRQRTKDWKQEDWEREKREIDALNQRWKAVITRGLEAEHAESQALARAQYDKVCQFWTPNRKAFIGLGQWYVENPEFRRSFDAVDPRLAEFLAEAMRIFAEQNLSA
ncbi:MAG TPA: MerR family transcriptional regulator [Oscillatoriaceae cyanobacterium]